MGGHDKTGCCTRSLHRWTRNGDAVATMRRCTKDGYTWVGRTSQAGFEAGWSTTEDIIVTTIICSGGLLWLLGLPFFSDLDQRRGGTFVTWSDVREWPAGMSPRMEPFSVSLDLQPIHVGMIALPPNKCFLDLTSSRSYGASIRQATRG